GAPFLTGNYGVAHALATYGDGTAQSAWLPALSTGASIGAVAFAEGQSALPARPAVRYTDGRLTGTKPAVTGGLHAHIALVYAWGDAGPVLVLAALDGVARTRVPSFDNSRGAADLMFQDTPATLLLGAHARPDSGADARAAALAILARQAIVTAHEQVGGAEAMMLRARDYANTRRAFGQPIGAFQSVKHRIAELYGLVEIARANALHAAAYADGPDLLKNAAAARLSAIDAYDSAARDCVQVHGGIGVTWEAGIHLHLRRTRALAIEQGNTLFWEDVLVDQLTGAAA
ncbi:MAG: acyl-CoA dehydrogenase family protein, partial [Sphingopyxis sp.]